MILRKLSKKLVALSKKYPVLALTGPRQSGKTTLVKHVFPGYSYLNLENMDHRIAMEEDPRGVLSQYTTCGVIIDEAQKVPHLFSYLQNIVDDSKAMGKFVLTGSQNFLLLEKITQSLAGRVALMTLLPFGLEEIKGSKFEKKHLNKYLFNGLYPPLHDRKIPPGDFYPLYIQTYIERDVRTITNVRDLSTFQKFLKLCAGRNGQMLNYTSLSNDCGIDQKTTKSWISILEASYIIYLLHPHYVNFNKRLVKQPKLYFYDTGLLCSLLGIEKPEQIETHYSKGAIFEAFVISEYIKARKHSGLQTNAYFWRDNVGHEIDLLIEKASEKIAIEIKSGETINDAFFKNLQFYHKISQNDINNNFLIYSGREFQKRKGGYVLPWNGFLGKF